MVRALLAHGFDGLGVERISARTLLGNTASQHVMAKCGLRRVGDAILEFSGQFQGRGG